LCLTAGNSAKTGYATSRKVGVWEGRAGGAGGISGV
jgi:hypothetical protein